MEEESEWSTKMAVFEDETARLVTRSGRSIRFVARRTDGLFGFRVVFKPLGIDVLGSCPTDAFETVGKTILEKYRFLSSADDRFLTRKQIVLRKRYLERFKEV